MNPTNNFTPSQIPQLITLNDSDEVIEEVFSDGYGEEASRGIPSHHFNSSPVMRSPVMHSLAIPSHHFHGYREREFSIHDLTSTRNFSLRDELSFARLNALIEEFTQIQETRDTRALIYIRDRDDRLDRIHPSLLPPEDLLLQQTDFNRLLLDIGIHPRLSTSERITRAWLNRIHISSPPPEDSPIVPIFQRRGFTLLPLDFSSLLYLKPFWTTARIVALVAACVITAVGIALISASVASFAGVAVPLIALTEATKWATLGIGIATTLAGVAGIAAAILIWPEENQGAELS